VLRGPLAKMGLERLALQGKMANLAPRVLPVRTERMVPTVKKDLLA